MVSFTCSHGRKRRIAGEIVSKAGPCQVQGHYYALEYVEAGKASACPRCGYMAYVRLKMTTPKVGGLIYLILFNLFFLAFTVSISTCERLPLE